MTQIVRDLVEELLGSSGENSSRHIRVDNTSKTQQSLMKMHKEDKESWARPEARPKQEQTVAIT